MYRQFHILLILLWSCSNSEFYYNKEYYEKWSGIHIPENATVIESIDNGEFVTTTVFRIDNAAIQKLISMYNFKPVEDDFRLRLAGNSFLKRNRAAIEHNGSFYY